MNASERNLRDTGYNIPQERAQVAKGARLLDKILPGWHNRVDLDSLHMAHGSMCMMGQLFGTNTETALAKEMYPDEWEALNLGYGYGTALCVESGGGAGMVPLIMAELDIDTDPKALTELDALRHVCGGHDTKCLWAEAVAARKAEDVP